MPIRGLRISPGLRLSAGDAVLIGARLHDTRLVQERLARFQREHRRWADAHEEVTALERDRRAARRHLSECDREQARAVEALACGLALDGRRRRNPFAKLGVPSPSVFVRLPVAKEAKAVHRLVQVVRDKLRVSDATLKLAQRADAAARAVEKAIAAVAKIEERLLSARRVRDVLAFDWHRTYTALRLVAKAAAAEGAPEVHTTMFAGPARERQKRARRRKRRRERRAEAEAVEASAGSPSDGPVVPASIEG